MSTLLWFRNDFRLADNPALTEALKNGDDIIPVFIWSPEEEGAWTPGAASKWWMHYSLQHLAERLQGKGSALIIRQGKSLAVLQSLIKETGATSVFWNRRYEPAIIKRDTEIMQTLLAKGINAKSFNGSLLFEPLIIKTGEGKPYQVFTPFWRTCLSVPPPAINIPEPRSLPPYAKSLSSDKIEDLGFLPKINWDRGFRKSWEPGEKGAHKALKLFLDQLAKYPTARDIPKEKGTSRLSPHLHFGEISPRQVWNLVRDHARADKTPGTHKGEEVYLREIGWREFAHHLLFHFPHTPGKPLREKFEKFPWVKNPQALKAWQMGNTGFPLVDAGMRELWHTGWMHNRVRMIAASFLVKDLRISWREGAQWFWDTLVDADLANNTLGWQWTAGCGADAAPYFRVFNPSTQAEKFDPTQEYIRKWIPELGTSAYPKPIVDHAGAREEALRSWRSFQIA